MFIKNQTFKDEDTLLEVLFDFGLGEATPFIQTLVTGIDADLLQNDAYQQYYNSLTDEEDQMELYAEEKDLRLAELLMEQFESFAVQSSKLYGVKGSERTLLYEVNLH
ncbi:hypothetical protein ACTHGU_02570 [Chitinophagaceae bacterium MMS25-I14]